MALNSSNDDTASSNLPRRQIAITRASVTSWAVIAAFVDQPTTRREKSILTWGKMARLDMSAQPAAKRWLDGCLGRSAYGRVRDRTSRK